MVSAKIYPWKCRNCGKLNKALDSTCISCSTPKMANWFNSESGFGEGRTNPNKKLGGESPYKKAYHQKWRKGAF